MMAGWANTWKDILSGGSPRWKITCNESHRIAHGHFQQYALPGHVQGEGDDTVKDVSVLCPLAGDDPFVSLLYRKGYSVTAIDLVPEAVAALRRSFGDDDSAWTREESDGDIVWTHTSGRATLISGDALKQRLKLNDSFDAIYDKDSFGALTKDLRRPFCDRMAEYTKDNAIVYLECKLKKGVDGIDNNGPPFSLRKDDLMDANHYGRKFTYVADLGTIYDLPGGMSGRMQQTGHILRRVHAPPS